MLFFLFRPRQSRKQQSRKDGNDRNYDRKFNECEVPLAHLRLFS